MPKPIGGGGHTNALFWLCHKVTSRIMNFRKLAETTQLHPKTQIQFTVLYAASPIQRA